MSRRTAKGIVEVNRTLIALLIGVDVTLFMLWLILAFVVKYPLGPPAGVIFMLFIFILAILVKISLKRK